MYAYIYARFSSADQAKGSSLERQLHNCRTFCEAKGWSHSTSRELVDEGISAYDGSNRSGHSSLAKFERMAHAGEIPEGSVLVVERLDRISRESPHAVVRFVSSMLEANIAIGIASNDRLYVGDVPFDQLIDMVVTAKLSNEESEKKSERLRAAWARKRRLAADGVPLTSKCPAWLYKSDDGTRYLIDIDKADVVRRIFEMTASGRGRSLVAQTLNKEGVPPISERANGWHPSYVQKILSGRAVLGEAQLHSLQAGRRVPQGPPLTDYFPPIVPHDLYRRAQAAIRARTLKGGRRG
ncbi:MAG: recombinase family protein, partial [Sphingobium sp.]